MRARDLAERQNRPAVFARIESGFAALEIAQQHYQGALEHLVRARLQATRALDCEQLAIVHFNLSALYLQLFDLERSVREAESAEAMLPCLQPPARVQALLQVGTLRSIEARSAPAGAVARLQSDSLLAFRRAIDQIDHLPPTVDGPIATRLLSLALNRLGAESGAMRDWANAERWLNQAYRLRLLTRDPNLGLTRFRLAQLKLDQGDLPLALSLVRSAKAGSSPELPKYLLDQLEGRIAIASGDLDAGLASLRSALRESTKWRGQIIPADAFRTSSEVGLNSVYEDLITALVTSAERSNDSRLIAESWEVSEMNRAASFRETMFSAQELRPRLGPEYWEALARLRWAESRAYGAAGSALVTSIAGFRSRLAELESNAGLSLERSKNSEKNLGRISLISFRRVLGSSRTLISFQLGEKASYRWQVTRDAIRVRRLLPAADLNRLSEDFRKAVEGNLEGQAEAGWRLYSALFEGIEDSPRQAWMLALDGKLFGVPFAALPTNPPPGKPNYLIEDRVIEIVPGTWAVGAEPFSFTGRFLGVGDPVYNRADPRFRPSGTSMMFAGLPFWPIGGTAELPRLIGSGREIEACARESGRPFELLSGTSVTRSRLMQSLNQETSTLHLATHFVPSRLAPANPMIALSLQPGRGVDSGLELLTGYDVATLSVPGALVVLSGCSSGSGRALPGAGLLGLTRAFLTAGASAVVASLWPTPDDSGELFLHFYRDLRASRASESAPAAALRSAQLAMLRTPGWRSSPHYWAAYQITSRSSGSQ